MHFKVGELPRASRKAVEMRLHPERERILETLSAPHARDAATIRWSLSWKSEERSGIPVTEGREASFLDGHAGASVQIFRRWPAQLAVQIPTCSDDHLAGWRRCRTNSAPHASHIPRLARHKCSWRLGGPEQTTDNLPDGRCKCPKQCCAPASKTTSGCRPS